MQKLPENRIGKTMIIENSTANDITEIFRLYGLASAYQQSKNVVVWPDFDRTMVENEISENRQWKLVIDGSVACVWCITFTDHDIWEERENHDSIYIHRIAVNPEFRGRNFVTIIVNWAKEYAGSIGRHFIRLDTLGNNTKLIEHYTDAGFTFLGMFRLENTKRLPLHYQKTPDCCLFEMKL